MKISFVFAYLALPAVVLLLTSVCDAKRIGSVSNEQNLQGKQKIANGEERKLQSVRLEFGEDFLFYLYALCFSSHTTAEVKGRGKVSMSEIQVGDEVLTSSGEFQTVYAMAHRSPIQSAKFVQIYTEDDEPLELSEKHMIFAQGKLDPVPADSIKVGDYLQSSDGAHEVTKISAVIREGVYNPLTTDGTIVASGIVSSAYSAFLSDDEWIKIYGYEVITHHKFFEKAIKPYKLFCTSISSELCKTENEKIMIAEVATSVADHWLMLGERTRMMCLIATIFVVYSMDLLLNLNFIALSAASIFMLMKARNMKSSKSS